MGREEERGEGVGDRKSGWREKRRGEGCGGSREETWCKATVVFLGMMMLL